MALQLIKGVVPHPHPHASFQYTLREGNECADWLAKNGAKEDRFLEIWHSCPPSLFQTLLADASGVVRSHP